MKMKCIICGNSVDFYFNKKWEYPFKEFLEEADFYKCQNCGFTFSKTVFEMEISKWEKLNVDFHNYIENPQNKKEGNQPPYLEQAAMINLLIKNHIIDSKSILDYAGGLGTLATILHKYYDISLPIYDPYIKSKGNNNSLYIEGNELSAQKVIINSAYLEHIRKRQDIEQLNRLVSDDGMLIMHTVVCENIPKDPDWFYIHPPVHSSLHTNKSMNLLMQQLGYISSIYSAKAKSWVLFKKEPAGLLNKIDIINKELQENYFYYKKGFVDYWKGF